MVNFSVHIFSFWQIVAVCHPGQECYFVMQDTGWNKNYHAKVVDRKPYRYLIGIFINTLFWNQSKATVINQAQAKCQLGSNSSMFIWTLFLVFIEYNNDPFYVTPCIFNAADTRAITAITTTRAISCPQNCPGKMLRSHMLESDSSITMKMVYCPDEILLPPKNCKTSKWESGNNPQSFVPTRFLEYSCGVSLKEGLHTIKTKDTPWKRCNWDRELSYKHLV